MNEPENAPVFKPYRSAKSFLRYNQSILMMYPIQAPKLAFENTRYKHKIAMLRWQMTGIKRATQNITMYEPSEEARARGN